MSELRAFRCDGCGAVIESAEHRTKERTRFEMPDGTTEDFFRDLCDVCGPAQRQAATGIKKAVPKRTRRTEVS